MQPRTEIRQAINAEDVAQQASREILDSIFLALETKPTVHIALTGGSVGILTLAKLAEQPDLDRVDFNRVHFWWGDERYVESSSLDRNANQAREVFFNKIQVPPTHIHEFPSVDNSMELNDGKVEFLKELARYFSSDPPTLDLLILGMGADGHIASLFPQHENLAEGQIVVAESNSPKPPAQRLSLSYESINASEKIVFVVSGLDKSQAVKEVHSNANSQLPAAKIAARGETIWFIDQGAGSEFWGC